MKWKECKVLVYEDLCRSTNNPSKKEAFKMLITNASFKMTFWFRIGSWLEGKSSWRVLYYMVFWHYKKLMYKTGIQLPIGTRIGGGLQFKHFNGIVINNNAIIGCNVTIFNDVTIGVNMSPHTNGIPPVISDNVVLCTGAKVIGSVTIGANSIIGANSVVTKDIPEGSVAVGAPAKVLQKNGRAYVDAYIKHK